MRYLIFLIVVLVGIIGLTLESDYRDDDNIELPPVVVTPDDNNNVYSDDMTLDYIENSDSSLPKLILTCTDAKTNCEDERAMIRIPLNKGVIPAGKSIDVNFVQKNYVAEYYNDGSTKVAYICIKTYGFGDLGLRMTNRGATTEDIDQATVDRIENKDAEFILSLCPKG